MLLIQYTVLRLPLLLLVSGAALCVVADVTELESQVKRIAHDVLGVTKFQSYLDRSINYEESTLDAETITNNVAQSLEAGFRDRFDVVRRLKAAVEENYHNYPTDNMRHAPDCCSVPLPVAAKDNAFETQVNRLSVCTGGRKRKVEVGHRKRYPDESLYRAMKNNIEQVPTIKWQYFGSEEGVLFNYPAFRFCDDKYDPRYRPWYVETVTQYTKEVVIVIDTSSSMAEESSSSKSLLSIAREAAITVVDTLNPNDSIAVVAFSSVAKTPPRSEYGEDCYQSQLARATPANRKYLIDNFIRILHPAGGTRYTPALEKAFQFFSRQNLTAADAKPPDKVILFLTDGRPQESKTTILNTIRTENAKLGNEVVIMTFAIGAASSEPEVEGILRDMAMQTDHDPAAGEVKHGLSKIIKDPENIRYELGTYYDFFSFVDDQQTVTVSIPYVDAWGLGLVTSACMQVVVGGQVKGVTCVDIVVDDLLSDVTYFRQDEFSYVFLMDELSRMYVHPLLPRPSNIKDDPVFVNFENLERGSDAQFVKDSMLRGESGTNTFSALLVRSRGDSPHEGVSHSSRETTYTWQKVLQTTFSLCVVVRSGDRQAQVKWLGSYPHNFLFHRLDIYHKNYQTDNLHLCKHLSQIATLNHSAVFLSAGTFLEPYAHLQTIETIYHLLEYTSYFEGNTDQNPGFRDSIRNSVAVTAAFDKGIPQFKANSFALWAYVGTADGVFRIIPASPYPQNYDPRVRPWFKRALNDRSKVVLSAPYEDAGGAGVILTISQAIYEGRRTQAHTDGDLVVAVMGVDITLNYLYEVIQQHHPQCKSTGYRCFVMDNSGFVVVHEDFLSLSKSDSVKAENVHVMGKEPYIAEKLLEAGQMTKAACVNYERTRKQYSWRIALIDRTFISNNAREPFEVLEIDGTNVFLVKISGTSARSYSSCSCRTQYGSTNKQCLSLRSPGDEYTTCECPCFRRADYESCTATFNTKDNKDASPPCTPEAPATTFTKYDPRNLKSFVQTLPLCVDTCELLADERKCLSATDCGWCETLRTCRQAKYCKRPKPAVTSEVSKGTVSKGNKLAVIGGTIGVILIIMVVVVVLIIRRRRGASPSRPNPSAPPAGGHHNPAYGEAPPPYKHVVTRGFSHV